MDLELRQKKEKVSQEMAQKKRWYHFQLREHLNQNSQRGGFESLKKHAFGHITILSSACTGY